MIRTSKPAPSHTSAGNNSVTENVLIGHPQTREMFVENATEYPDVDIMNSQINNNGMFPEPHYEAPHHAEKGQILSNSSKGITYNMYYVYRVFLCV